MTSSRLSVADVAGVVPRIAARAVLPPLFVELRAHRLFLFAFALLAWCVVPGRSLGLHAERGEYCLLCALGVWVG